MSVSVSVSVSMSRTTIRQQHSVLDYLVERANRIFLDGQQRRGPLWLARRKGRGERALSRTSVFETNVGVVAFLFVSLYRCYL